jgi:hypothetical protein
MVRISTLTSDVRVTAVLSVLRRPRVHLGLLGAFGLLGWGTFVQGTLSSGAMFRDLQAQIHRLEGERDQAKQDLGAARQEIAAVTKRLTDVTDRVNQTGTLATPPTVKTGGRPAERTTPAPRTKL